MWHTFPVFLHHHRLKFIDMKYRHKVKIEQKTAKVKGQKRRVVDHGPWEGKYTDEDPIVVDIQLWNNRWGTENVEDLTDYDICFFFDMDHSL